MDRFRPWAVTALVAATLLTWGNRIPLLWSDNSLSRSDKLTGSVPIALFVLLAIVALVGLVASGPVLAGAARQGAYVLAGWSILYWLVRLPMILLRDHPAAFKAVHTVLAAVAVALAAWVIVTLNRRPARVAPV